MQEHADMILFPFPASCSSTTLDLQTWFISVDVSYEDQTQESLLSIKESSELHFISSTETRLQLSFCSSFFKTAACEHRVCPLLLLRRSSDHILRRKICAEKAVNPRGKEGGSHISSPRRFSVEAPAQTSSPREAVIE